MKQHELDHYFDGRVSVAYCKVCSAEGDKLLEDCPQKISSPLDKSHLTEKNQTTK